MHNFNLFGPSINQPPYGHSPPRFQGVRIQHQGSWLQHTPPSFQGFHLQESFGPSMTMQFGAVANNSPSMLQFSQSAGAVASISSHGSESSSQWPARKEKEPLIIEESSSSSEEGPKRRTHINYTEEENLRLLSSWLHHSTDPVNGINRKSVLLETRSSRVPQQRTNKSTQEVSQTTEVTLA